jgi:hypothetical protein
MLAKIDRPGMIIPRHYPLPTLQPDNTADQAAFTVMDGDGDNTLSKDEWKRAGWSDDRFKQFDADGDGKVSRDEFLQARRYENEFNSKDWNKDGALNRQEFEGFRYMLDKVGGAAKDAMQKVANCLPFPGLKDRFQQFDTNNDGKVSKEEYMAGRRKEDQRPIYWQPLLKDQLNLDSLSKAKQAS